MSAAKTAEEKLVLCTGTCGRLTRPSRMHPLASIETVVRAGSGMCTKCYSVIRRAKAAEKRAETERIIAKAKPRPETKRPEVIEEERIRHIAAGLDRFLARRKPARRPGA